MYQNYVDGDLRVPNMEVMAKSLFEVFINRCAVKEGELESNSLSFFERIWWFKLSVTL